MKFWKRSSLGQAPERVLTGSTQDSGTQSLLGDGELPADPQKQQFGLFVLADQDETDADAVDIVAVHGLNGHWMRTWQASSPQRSTYWLADLLPDHLPRARIMSFGYDSKLLFSKSTENIGQFADHLLEALWARRQSSSVENARSIIFICHSLGGIVVKKALIKAAGSERHSSLLESTRGIMFFGTPHRGSSLATWGNLFTNIMSAATVGTLSNKNLTGALEERSAELQMVSESFVEIAKPLQLISFYETDRMPFMSGKIVEEGSATLGSKYPNEVAIPMKGDHRSMCHFVSKTDIRFRIVWTNLQNMTKPAAGQAPARYPRLRKHQATSQSATGIHEGKIVSEETDPGNQQNVPELAASAIPGWSGIPYSVVKDPTPKTQIDTAEDESPPKQTGSRHQQYGTNDLPSTNTVTSNLTAALSLRQREVEKSNNAVTDAQASPYEEKEARTRDKACYKYLSNITEYETHRYRVSDAVPGTCQWLLDHARYRSWRSKQESGLLWLSADAGCGKSVLVSYLIDHLRSADNKLRVPEVVCFFFFMEDNEEQKNACDAVLALLHQLYTAQPWLTHHAARVFATNGRKLPRSFPVLWNILTASIHDPKSRDVLLILDGLDECEPVTRGAMLHSLRRLYTSSSRSLDEAPFVKMIVASRPDNDIKIAFDVLPTIRLRGEDEPEAISMDVELVVQHHIERAAQRGLPMTVLNDVKDALIRGADRTFLWTTLVIDLMDAKRGASRRDLLGILRSKDIYRIYERLLEDSPDSKESRRLLSLVVAAARPLTLNELSVALVIDVDHDTLADLELDVVHNFEERIKALCGNFVRVIRSTVYLVHQTARAFLLEDSHRSVQLTGKPTGSWKHTLVLREANNEFLDICLRYLQCFERSPYERSNSRQDQPSWQFLEYAARFWIRHYTEVAPNISDNQIKICILLCDPWKGGFHVWYPLAMTSARDGGRSVDKRQLRDGIMRRDIALSLGLKEVARAMDRLLDPAQLEQPWHSAIERTQFAAWRIDKEKLSPGNTRVSWSLHGHEEVSQPHTITPGAFSTSPLRRRLDDEARNRGWSR